MSRLSDCVENDLARDGELRMLVEDVAPSCGTQHDSPSVGIFQPRKIEPCRPDYVFDDARDAEEKRLLEAGDHKLFSPAKGKSYPVPFRVVA